MFASAPRRPSKRSRGRAHLYDAITERAAREMLGAAEASPS